MRTLFAFLLMVSVAQAEQIGDMNADGQVGLAEAIIALQVVTEQQGEDLGQYIPATGNATESHVYQGMTFSNASGNNLIGTLTMPPPVNRALGCMPGPIPEIYVWEMGQCYNDCHDLYGQGYLLPHTQQFCNTACDNFQLIIEGHPPEFGAEVILCSMPAFGPT